MQVNSILNLAFSSPGQGASPLSGSALSENPSAGGKGLSGFTSILGGGTGEDLLENALVGDGSLLINNPQGGILLNPQIAGAANSILQQVLPQGVQQVVAASPNRQLLAQQYLNSDGNSPVDQSALQSLFAAKNTGTADSLVSQKNSDDPAFFSSLLNQQTIGQVGEDVQTAALTSSADAKGAVDISQLASATGLMTADMQQAQKITDNYTKKLDKIASLTEQKLNAISLDDNSAIKPLEKEAVLASSSLDSANSKLKTDFNNFDNKPIDINEIGMAGRLHDINHSKLEAQLKQIDQAQIYRSPLEQIKIKISQGFELGQDKISVKLHPEELGKVDVEMNVDSDGRTNIRIVADKSETLDFLRRDSNELQRALREVGVQADDKNMQFSLNQNGNGDGTNQQANKIKIPYKSQELSSNDVRAEYEYEYKIGSNTRLNIVA